MSGFLAFFSLEFKRFLSRRNLIILIVFLLILLYLAQMGVNDHKNNIRKGEKFQSIESILYGELSTYEQYSIQGIRILFIPGAEEILFTNSNIFSDLSSRINSVVILNIYNNLKGKSLFMSNPLNYWDFSGILFLFGSLLVLFYGYESFRDKEYLKFLSSFLSNKTVFFYFIFTRIILIALTIIIIFASVMVLVLMNGFDLSSLDYSNISGYFLSILLLLVFFFLTGSLIGFINSTLIGLTTLIVFWFVAVFLITGLISTLAIQKGVNPTSDYQTELEKIKVVTDFEKRAIEENGKFDRKNIEGARKIIEGYWNKDYKKIEALEEKLKNEIVVNINRYRHISIFFPTTFYQSTSMEVSSRGYDSFIDFYSYLQELKRKFVRFWIDRVFYNDPGVMVNFLKKGNENLFYAKSRLPGNFAIGALVNLVYIIILTLISILSFKKFLYTPGIKKPVKERNPFIVVNKEQVSVLVLYEENHGFKDHLYNLFSGRVNQYNKDIQIEIDKSDLSDTEKQDFIYLCHPEKIPQDISAGALIAFTTRILKSGKTERKKIYGSLKPATRRKTFGKLERLEKGLALLAAVSNFRKKIFLVDDASGMHIEYIITLNDTMKAWAKSGASVIYITKDFEIKVDRIKAGKSKDFFILEDWSDTVSNVKKWYKDEQE